MSKKTHVEIKEPKLSVRRLADLMAASEQGRRPILQSCKYRAIARVIQHSEAQAIVANHLRIGEPDDGSLHGKAEYLRNKLADDDFEADVNDHNADYVDRFAKVESEIELPKADREVGEAYPPLFFHGVKITLTPSLRFRRKTKTNKVRVGALMLRYSKGRPLPEATGLWQSAAIFGFLNHSELEAATEPEKQLCITVDAYSGLSYPAPGNAVYLFNEMKAVMLGISERWPAIKPPKGAVF